MRWKLVLIASLLAALAGAGASLAVAYWLRGSTVRLADIESFKTNIAVLSTLIIPLAAITFASIFVYRHTSRRRPLQALVTTLLAIILTLAAFVAATAFFSKTM